MEAQPARRSDIPGPPGEPRAETVLLIGNPNVGKSAIFFALTGRYVTVSNYPGTTIEVARGALALEDGSSRELVDTPGTTSLTPLSGDEQVTCDLVRAADPATTAGLVVADARNLRRGIALALELDATGLEYILAVNMIDEARARGLEIDIDRLSATLGVPAVATAATLGEGISALRSLLSGSSKNGARVEPPGAAPAKIVGETAGSARCEDRHGSREVAPVPRDAVASAPRPAEPQGAPPAGDRGTEAERRLLAAEKIALDVVTERHREATPGSRLAAGFGRAATHPLFGWPILCAVLYASYLIVGKLGAGVAVNFLEGTVFGTTAGHGLNGILARASISIGTPAFLHDLLFGGYGVVTMALTYALALILPIVGFFFVVFGILEDTGYLPRLAVITNRAFSAMGLNGKAVLPMVLGLGCDTMATLATRILATRRERLIVSLLLALAVPCSAQLAVVFGLFAAVSAPKLLAVWVGVVLAILLASGWLAGKLIPGERSDFVIELPPIRRPRLANIVRKTLARIEWYLREAVPLFVVGTLILFALDRSGLLAVISRAAEPLVTRLLGLPRECAAAFVVGFLRRDYGAVYLFDAARAGALSPAQVLVATVTITLFLPCVASYLMLVREFGMRTALAVAVLVFAIAFGAGGAVHAAIGAW